MAFDEMIEFRKRFGFSQARAAEVFGIRNRLLISQWETGRSQPKETIRRIVKTLMALPSAQAQDFLGLMDPKLSQSQMKETPHHGN